MSSLASPNPSHTFRLLAFGASMTEGFVGGQHTYPYAAHLRGPLEALFSKSSTTVEIIVDGEGGDQVVSPPGRFLPRLKRHCEDKEGGKGYDWVLIMGGTNDLGAGRKGEDIYEGLSKCFVCSSIGMMLFYKRKIIPLVFEETDLTGSADSSWDNREMLDGSPGLWRQCSSYQHRRIWQPEQGTNSKSGDSQCSHREA